MAPQMVSEGIRKTVLYVGAVIVLLGIAMIAFAGGGMIVMDSIFLLVGGPMVGWAVYEGRKRTAG